MIKKSIFIFIIFGILCLGVNNHALSAVDHQELLDLVQKEGVSENTFNIYYFGGSSMIGEPYAPEISIPKLIEYMLDDEVDTKKIVSVNLGMSGKDFDFVLQMLKVILEGKDIFKPSLFVVYSGHNEFLKYHDNMGFAISNKPVKSIDDIAKKSSVINRLLKIFKTYRLEIDERTYFDKPLFEKEKYFEVIHGYCNRLNEAANLASNDKIPLIISTVAANYSDWDPNRSVFEGNKANQDNFLKIMLKGMNAEKRHNLIKAAEFYSKALFLCPSFAETYYRIGKAYESLGKYDKAWESYLRAVDNDMMPLRAMTIQNDYIRSMGRVAYIVDAVNYLKSHSNNGLIGFNFFIEGHHPNIQGYILISEAVSHKIKDIFSISQGLKSLNEDRARAVFGIDSEKMFNVYNSRGQWVYRIATWRYNPVERLALAEDFFNKAISINPARYEPYFGLAVVNFLRKNRQDAAYGFLEKAKQINMEEVARRIKEPWIQSIIMRCNEN